MKTKLKYFSAVLTVLVIIFLALRASGGLLFFRINDLAGFPTFDKDQLVWASNIPDVERFDIIVHEYNKDTIAETRYGRICGMPGDKIEMKEGILYVNDLNADWGLKLAHNYSASHHRSVERALERGVSRDFIWSDRENRFVLNILDTDALAIGLKDNRMISDKAEEVQEIFYNLGVTGNYHFFGPLIIPEGMVFLCGDNRDFCVDSRHTGLIELKNVIAVVLGK